jgi:hypothetical protein
VSPLHEPCLALNRSTPLFVSRKSIQLISEAYSPQQHTKDIYDAFQSLQIGNSQLCTHYGIILNLWWHFQFGWTRTNQEVSSCIRGFSCFSRLTGMAPAQANDTHLCMAQEKAAFSCLGFFPWLGARRIKLSLIVHMYRGYQCRKLH